MSDHSASGHRDMDYQEHIRTYHGFLTGTKVLLGLAIVLLLGMLVFLV